MLCLALLAAISVMIPQSLAAHDTDGDGIPDSWELTYGFDPDNPLDAGVDINGNGLSNLEEYTNGYDPLSSDTDSDGIINTAEVEGFFGFFTDPIKEDTDDDGLSDLIEIAYYINFRDERDLVRLTGENISLIQSLRSDYSYELDPLNNDTDGDGLEDGAEVVAGTSPVRFDTDGDGLSDGDEVNIYATDPLKRDTDADWLSDFEEVQKGEDGYVTDPLDSDTDDDGMIDGEESMPLGSVPIPPSNHSLSFKKFVSGDAYVDTYITTVARVVKPPTVDSGTNARDRYTLELDDPLEKTTGVHIELAIGNATFHYLYNTGGMQIFDDDFGFAPMIGDKLLIVARAGSITGLKRPLTIRTSANDTDGFIYLIANANDLSGRNVSSTDYIKMRHDLLSTSSPILPAEGGSSDETGDTGETEVASSTLNPSRIVLEADLPVMGEDGNMSARVTAYLMDITGVPIDPAPDVTFEITAGDAWINESGRTTIGAFTSVNVTASAMSIVNVTASSSGIVSDEITIMFEKSGSGWLIPFLLAVIIISGAAFIIIKKRKNAAVKTWVAGKVKKGKGGVYTVKIKKGEESKAVKLEKSEYAKLKKNKKIKKGEYLIVMK